MSYRVDKSYIHSESDVRAALLFEHRMETSKVSVDTDHAGSAK